MVSNNNDWENRYLQGQTGWDRGTSSANLLYWIEKGYLKPGRVLVPGCGNGYEVLTLAEKGFEVVAIDIAPTPIANLNAALERSKLQAELIQADFFEWEPTKPFDAIYEQTSLCALPPNEWQRYEKCLFNWLKPAGKLFAQFMQTGVEGGPPFHCEINDMRKLFKTDKWKWSAQHETQVVHSGGKYEDLYLLEKIT